MTPGAISTNDSSAPVLNRPFRNVLPILLLPFVIFAAGRTDGSCRASQGFIEEEVSGNPSQQQNKHPWPPARHAMRVRIVPASVTCPPHSTGILAAGCRIHMVEKAG